MGKAKQQAKSDETSVKKIPASQIIMVVIAGLLAGVAFYMAKPLFQSYFGSDTKAFYNNKNWEKQTLSNGLTIETPVALIRNDSLLKSNFSQLTGNLQVRQEVYHNTNAENTFIVMVNYSEMSNTHADLELAASSFVEQIQGLSGIKNFMYTESDTLVNMLPAVTQSGYWEIGSMESGFKQVFITSHNQLWYIICIYELDDKYGLPVSERILNSIKITPKPHHH